MMLCGATVVLFCVAMICCVVALCVVFFLLCCCDVVSLCVVLCRFPVELEVATQTSGCDSAVKPTGVTSCGATGCYFSGIWTN